MRPGLPSKPWSVARVAFCAAFAWSAVSLAQPAPDGGADNDPLGVGDSPELPDDGPNPPARPTTPAPDEPLPTRPNPVTGTTRPVRARMFTRADDRAEHERVVAAQRLRRRRNPAEPEQLELPGIPDAWFFRSRAGAGRQRVYVYLHARGADPRENCIQFAPVVTPRGWLICPQGPGIRSDGHRVWNNNAALAHSYTMAALAALDARFPRRVRRTDNVVMGFSEGAFVAMQTGLAEPVVFPRWVIFAAHDGYVGMNTELYPAARRALRRVYLLTGAGDGIVDRTRRAAALMRREHLGRVEMRILDAAGHQLPPNFVPEVRRALTWVTSIR